MRENRLFGTMLGVGILPALIAFAGCGNGADDSVVRDGGVDADADADTDADADADADTDTDTAASMEFRYRFGVCYSFPNFLPDDDKAALVETAVEAGATWIRISFAWPNLEISEGVWDFAEYDEVVALARATGLKILGVAGGCPAWVAPTMFHPPPAERMDDFDTYFSNIAAHFSGDLLVDAWEVMNEVPSDTLGWTPEVYVSCQRHAYDALKSVAPDTPVLVGGLYRFEGMSAEPTWLRRILEEGVLAYCDGIACHPYPHQFYYAVPNESFMREGITAMRGVMEEFRGADAEQVPIWITESGWDDCGNRGWPRYCRADELGAAYMLRTMIFYSDLPNAQYVNLERWFYYNIRDAQEEQCGLVDDQWTRKRKFRYYKTFLETVGKCTRAIEADDIGTFAAQSMPEHLEVHCFTKEDGTLYVAMWNNRDTPEGGSKNSDMVDISVLDRGYLSVNMVDIETGSQTLLGGAPSEGRWKFDDLAVSWDVLLLAFPK